jgi:hypothetical protein
MADANSAVQVNRRQWFMVLLAAPGATDQPLLVRRDDESLRVSAPQIRFLTGRPLSQLRDGVSVSFASQVSILTDLATPAISRVVDRFVISYDLWEERFAAARMGPPPRTASRMTSAACEAWCLDQMISIPPTLSTTRAFWVRLELRAEEGRLASSVLGEPGINVTRLIELFSRPPRSQQPRWLAAAGPLRLADLK